MKVVRHTGAFEHLLKVFRREVSSRPSTLPMLPVQEGDVEFGSLNLFSLVPIIHSDLGGIADFKRECELKEKPFPQQFNGISHVLNNCLMEAAISQLPESMMATRLELRSGYELVAPPGACVLPGVNYKDDTLDDFWTTLERIMCGAEVYPPKPMHDAVRGQLVGRVTHDVVKQLVIFNHRVYGQYQKWIEMTEDELHRQHLNDTHFDFLANKLIIERMSAQRGIVSNILGYGIQFQGFDARLANEFAVDNAGYSLRINPNWDIVVECV